MEAVAERVGVRVNAIPRSQVGKRDSDLDPLSKLASVYDVHPAALPPAPEEGPG
ncbi:MAG: helix-turn-helix transcriptional regulator [Acetobacteraceae bacterium]|nr:helix-turn-helix transcriptional regulator [Acetobacteraceae bacterium]